jgi:predicted ATPase/signal transduction histidine kinase
MVIGGTLGSYTLRQRLYEANAGAAYRAVRVADQRPVILKVLDPLKCRARDVERLRNEYELEQALDGSAVVRPIALETLEGMPVLVMEDFGGEPLERFRLPLPLDRFLPLAVRIVAAIEHVHSRGLVHRDLRPENIVVSSAGDVRITNFGNASRLPREQMVVRSIARLTDDSLPYISPEQTGRVNRPVDRRSDLYSLGVTFYQLLTGRLPFGARDPLGWVHCHLARLPAPPTESALLLPEVVSNIVLKLLAKLPEDRYQSAAGLKYDLQRCLDAWQRERQIAPFPLGTRDWSDRLQVPRTLYGREADAAALIDAFERTAATGTPELTLVSGQAGVGKSSLVQEVRKPAADRRGYFVSAKFDRYKREIPYLTFAEVCREIVLDVLSESADSLERWRGLALRSVAPNGQVLANMIPELGLFLGPQPPVEDLPPVEAENRVRFLFRRFLGVFAQPGRPLTIFLDDLQWADTASLRLLEYVIGQPEAANLFIVCAYRDNEVSSSHPLTGMIARLLSVGAKVNHLLLRPLSPDNTVRLVADTVRSKPEDTVDLARLVHAKTGGNPFFAIQFLKELEHDRLIALSPQDGCWRWDITKIAEKGVTDNVVELMVNRLKLLPSATQEACRLCACVGHVVDCGTLSTLSPSGLAPLEDSLRPAVEEDLLLRVENAYRFPHDRVHEAAYALIPESERAAAHLAVGRSLLARIAPEKLEENIFEVVGQLNRGATLIESQDERDRLARLNRIAGNRAKASGAYASAVRYFSNGAALLGPDAWKREHDLVFSLELGQAECEYIAGSREGTERTLSTLVERSKDRAEAAAAACVQIRLYMTQGRPDKAVAAGTELLRQFGIDLPAHPSRDQVLREYKRYWESLGDRPIEQLVDLPLMTDPAWEGASEVLLQLLGPATVTDPFLVPMVPIYALQLGLEHGHCDAACFAYPVAGTATAFIEGNYEKAARLAQVATDLMDRKGLVRHRPLAIQTLADLRRWIKPVREMMTLRQRQFELAEKGGEPNIAGYAITFGLGEQLFVGDPLEDVLDASVRGLEFVRRAGFALAVDTVTDQQRLVLSLQGKTEAPGFLGGADFDEHAFEAHLDEAGPLWALARCWHYVRKLQAGFFAGDYAAVLDAAVRAKESLWTSPAYLERVEHAFYWALAAGALWDDAAPAARAKYRERLVKSEKKLAAWTRACPDNFEDRHALVAAELARIDGASEHAATLYEQAIAAARKSNFPNGQALAYELASNFYRARGFALIADTYIREARDAYLRWGAHGKVRQIDRLHPTLLRAPPEAPAPAGALSQSPPEQLDLLSVLRATQGISREIDQDALLRTLLEVVLQEGGARTARLVLVRGDDLRLEGETATIGGPHGESLETRLLGSVPVSSASPLPVSVLNYVRRTKERVLIDDARADAGSFAADPYLAAGGPRSILCQPVLRQDQVIALLLLENELVPGVFTPSRLTALELLATQAAISIENALLLRREHSARLEAEAARARVEVLLEERAHAEGEARFIAEVAKVLAESLDDEETLSKVARQLVPLFGDWCVLGIAEGEHIRVVAGAHVDPSKEPLLSVFRERAPSKLELLPEARALAGGTPLVIDMTEEFLRTHFPDAVAAQAVRGLGARSALLVPFAAHGRLVGWLGLVSAEAQRYEGAPLPLLEEIARRAATAIENARLYQEAQNSIRARDEFLAVASHELRTPVTSLLLMAQSLRAGKVPPTPANIVRAAELFERQVAKLTSLIDDMMSIGRILVGRLEIHRAPVDLAALVRDEVERSAPAFARARCAVTVRAEHPVVGNWDGPKLGQVVANLLTNATKFGAGKPIEIAVDGAGSAARLTVVDHGIGIDAKALPHIFEKFERAASSHSYGGLGLGLFIVRNIVEAMGGRVRAESVPNVETRFSVELPADVVVSESPIAER